MIADGKANKKKRKKGEEQQEDANQQQSLAMVEMFGPPAAVQAIRAQAGNPKKAKLSKDDPKNAVKHLLE